MEPIYGRPELTKDMGAKRFLEFYYLNTEMESFLKANGLDYTGGRNELKDRIALFLSGGKGDESKFILKPEKDENIIYDDTVIEAGLIFGEKQIRYFESEIGLEFVPYDDFVIWLEENAGKTYGEAVGFWYLIRDDVEADH